jgi:hypothetical protein
MASTSWFDGTATRSFAVGPKVPEA